MTRRFRGIWLVPTMVGASLASGQTVAPTDSTRDMRRVAIERWFFASPPEVTASRVRLSRLMARLDGMRSSIRSSSAALSSALAITDSVSAESTRLTSYFHLRAAIDIRDLAAAHAEDSIDAEVASRTKQLSVAIRRIAADSIKRWNAMPSLSRYKFMIEV